MPEQDDGEDDQLGVTCVIVGCEARLVSLRDGWPSTTRDGPVCADCWDFNSEHGHFPDEEPEHELVTDGGQPADAVEHLYDRDPLVRCNLCRKREPELRPCCLKNREAIPVMCDSCYVDLRKAARLDLERDAEVFGYAEFA